MALFVSVLLKICNLIRYSSVFPMVTVDKVNVPPETVDEKSDGSSDGAGGSINEIIISPTPSIEEAPSTEDGNESEEEDSRDR